MSQCEVCGHELKCPACSGRCGGKARVKKGFGSVKKFKDLADMVIEDEAAVSERMAAMKIVAEENH